MKINNNREFIKAVDLRSSSKYNQVKIDIESQFKNILDKISYLRTKILSSLDDELKNLKDINNNESDF